MSPDPGIALTVHDDLPVVDAAVVDAGLGAFNLVAAPLADVRPLACFARDDAGIVVGGAVGRTWGDCCELRQLWVADAYRGRGIARRLVRAFEQRASARGCRTFYLETFSFQAPDFYRTLGYEVAAAIDGFAPGVARYTMVRRDG